MGVLLSIWTCFVSLISQRHSPKTIRLIIMFETQLCYMLQEKHELMMKWNIYHQSQVGKLLSKIAFNSAIFPRLCLPIYRCWFSFTEIDYRIFSFPLFVEGLEDTRHFSSLLLWLAYLESPMSLFLTTGPTSSVVFLSLLVTWAYLS